MSFPERMALVPDLFLAFASIKESNCKEKLFSILKKITNLFFDRAHPLLYCS